MLSRSIPLRCALLALGFVFPGIAQAQPRWIDPALRQELALAVPFAAARARWTRTSAPSSPSWRGRGELETPEVDTPELETPTELATELETDPSVAVVIDFDDDSFAALAALPGVRVSRAEGAALRWRHFVAARIDARGLESLESSRFVRRVWRAPPRGIPMLDHTTTAIGVPAARGAGNPILTGRGVAIGTIDSAIDVFHPAFFHGDGGYYDWIDANGNGVLDPDVDYIDLDRDGNGDEDEIARVLPATPLDLRDGASTDALRIGSYDPEIDWLYLDIDGDGKRDLAPSEGWNDESPGLGEPIFVADELDGDLRIDPEERLIRLGTSKVRRFLVGALDSTSEARVYERGVDLSAAQLDYTGGALGYADTLHATAVAGILAGDLPLVGRRWVGVAPEAELTVAFDLASTDASAGLLWTLDQSPDVVVYEFGQWTNVALDGSDAVSQLIDSSSRLDDVLHVCAAGNLGGGSKHATATIPPGEAREFAFTSFRQASAIQLSVHSRIHTAVRLVLIEPNGNEHAFEPGALSTNGAILTTTSETEREWTIQNILLFDEAGLPTGRWTLVIVSESDEPARVHAYLGDQFGFAATIEWDPEFSSDANTISWPATADECLAVGAIPGHLDDEGTWYEGLGASIANQVRDYSSRGPRIDGVPQIGLVAPDNPWSPLGRGLTVPEGPIAPSAAYQVFSGTSGAAPHVGGVAALLRERGMSAADARRALLLADRTGGAPADPAMGFGPLDAARSLGVVTAGSPPIITLSAVPAGGRDIRLIPEASDPDGDALTVRWDDRYDGSWDTEYGPVEERVVSAEDSAIFRVKVRVRDAGGRIAEAAIIASTQRAVSPSGGGIDLQGGGCSCEIGARALSAHRFLLGIVFGLALLSRRRNQNRRRQRIGGPDRSTAKGSNQFKIE